MVALIAILCTVPNRLMGDAMADAAHQKDITIQLCG